MSNGAGRGGWPRLFGAVAAVVLVAGLSSLGSAPVFAGVLADPIGPITPIVPIDPIAPTPSSTPPARVPSDDPPAQSVDPQPARTTVVMTTPSQVDYGTPIELAATVTDASGAAAIGSLQFTVGDGVLVGSPIELVDGKARLVYGSIPNPTIPNPVLPSPPSLQIGATFIPADAAVLAPSEGSAVIEIRPATTMITVSYTAEQALEVAEQVSVSAVIEHAPLGEGEFRAADPTGTVEFSLGGIVVATAPVLAGSNIDRGFALADVVLLQQGDAELVAVYSGDVSYGASTSSAVVIPVAAATPPNRPIVAKPSPSPTPTASSTPTPMPAAAPPATSEPIEIASSPVAEVRPDRRLVIVALVTAMLMAAAAGALIAIRVRRRAA